MINKLAIIYSYVEREFFPTEEQYITEKDAERDANIIADEIRKLGVETILIPGNDKLTEELLTHKPEMVLNLVDSIKGKEYLAATIPGILDMLNITFTGAGLLGLALTYNKFLTSQLLQSARIPVPNFQIFYTPGDILEPYLRFPLISKLNEIHGAVEINETAIAENEKQLRERLAFLINTYDQPIIVEEYISGREITAFVLQGNVTKIYLAEKIFNKPDQKYIFSTFQDQWGEEKPGEEPFHYEKYEDTLLKEYVKKAFDTTDMEDYAKFDIRLDSSGRYFFIDSNANPAFGPQELMTAMGYIVQKLYGVPFAEILKRLINNTIGNGTNGDEQLQNNG